MTQPPGPVGGPARIAQGGEGAAAASGASIPSRFIGTYAAEGRCGVDGEPTRVVLSADGVRFHESSGPVLQVDAGGATLAATFRLTGEGETRDANYSLRLEDSGQVLVDTASGLRRVRCG